MSIRARTRRIDRRVADELGLDEFGNLSISKGLPDFARLVAAGKIFIVDMHAGTAKAPAVAAPTTSPEWGLYNASPHESLVVLEAACTIKSGTQGLGLALMGAAALGKQTEITTDYAGTIKTCCDGSPRKPDFYLTNNPTLVGGTPAWHVLAAEPGNTIAQVNIGSGLVADVNGKLIARPGGGMTAFEVIGPTGTAALFTVSFLVAMIDLDRY